MRELQEILEYVEALGEAHRTAALATVIATTGSTYRRPGARMLVTPNETVGAVSAGCLEDEVISVARRVLSQEKPEVLRFDTTEEMDAIAGTGLGCRGTIEVFVEPLTPDANLGIYRAMRRHLRSEKGCTLALVVAGDHTGRAALFTDGQLQGTSELEAGLRDALRELDGSAENLTCELSDGKGRVYLERVEPPLKLVVFGAGFDAIPLVQLADKLGFHVTVVDPRPDYLTPERFPEAERLILAHPPEIGEHLEFDDRTHVVVMTHNYLYDLEILQQGLLSEAPYVGQMGPRERTAELLEDLEERIGPLPLDRRGKLHGPVGLDVGAETPEEIALSILGEMLAVHRGRNAGFLRERDAPIHNR